MAVTDSFLGYVLEQLTGIGRVRSRRMFGAVGLYSGDVFFAIVARNDVCLTSIAYYQVPADVIEDAESMVAWARKALRVAASGGGSKRR